MKILEKITGIMIALFCAPGGMAADTCIPTTFNVTYGCNGGTVAGTLPAATTAQYGQQFMPTTITAAMCNPPAGHFWGGTAIIVDGRETAYYSDVNGLAFTYYYTSDIEIGPHWVPIAKPAVIRANLDDGGQTYTYTNGNNGTWTVDFWYGRVKGVSKCSTIATECIRAGQDSGYIAPDQLAIENSTGGPHCYCKLTEPNIVGSEWVFRYGRNPDSYCSSYCAKDCALFVSHQSIYGSRFRASVFAAAGN